MRTNNNELIVHRGETFTIDKFIQNRDGSPYIVSSQLNNLYWVLSVSSTLYDQRNRYVKNWWLSLKDTKKFFLTVPINIR